jgi:hypothetical protein
MAARASSPKSCDDRSRSGIPSTSCRFSGLKYRNSSPQIFNRPSQGSYAAKDVPKHAFDEPALPQVAA